MKDLLREFGKLFYDIAKILIAIAVVTPFVKNEQTPTIIIYIIVMAICIGSMSIFLGGEKWKKR